MRAVGRTLLGSSLLLALLGLGCGAGTKAAHEELVTHRIDVAACSFPLSGTYADSEFTAVVSFTVSERHEAADLRVFANLPAIPDAAFETCMAGWTLPALPAGTQVFVAFRWEGAEGWKYLRLSAEAVDYFEEISLGGLGVPV